MKISALILARNEEKFIEDALTQLDFADEIIVLDQGSEDKTLKIAKKYTDKVFVYNNQSFDQARNLLAAKAKGDWLLYVDADERLSPDLIEEINQACQNDQYAAFYFARKNIVLWKWLKHGGWWPDYVPRLFKKNKLQNWHGHVHESPEVDGEFGYLETPLNHLTATSLEKMLAKTIRWAQTEAQLSFKANHPSVTIFKVIKAFFSEFINRYIIKAGFLDGTVGLIEAIFQGLHRCAKLTYLWELQNDAGKKFQKACLPARQAQD